MQSLREMAGRKSNLAERAEIVRHLPVGAEVQPGGGVHFRLWAPKCQRVSVQINSSAGAHNGQSLQLASEEGGYFSGFHATARAGDRYWLLVDDDDQRLPDPASRFQPEGPHGPSEIIFPVADALNYEQWRGRLLSGL